MSGLFYTFNIAKRGMAAQQTSLHVTSHNVSNANTYGFSRQRAIHSTTSPFPMPALNNPVGAGQIGTGVDVSNITRARDEFVDNSIRRETSNLLTYSAREQFLDSIEAVINEPGDTGISNTLTKFWDAWQGISTNPENATARKLIVSTSNALADSFKQTYTQLEELEKDLASLQREQIFSVNSILKQIGDLNEQIKQVSINNQTPNDLLDRRDVLLDKLSEHIDFKTEKGDFNSIRIVSGNRYLLSDSRVLNGIASVDDVNFKIDGKEFDKASFPLNIKDMKFPQEMTLKVYVDGDLNKPVDKTIKIENVNDLKKYFNADVNVVTDPADPTKTVTNVRIDSIKNSSLIYSKGTKDDEEAIKNYAEPFEFKTGAIRGLDNQKKEISDYKNQINNMVRSLVISVNTIHSNNNGVHHVDGKDNYIDFFTLTDKDNNPIDIENCDHPAKSFKVNQVIEEDVTKINAGGVIKDGTTEPDSGDNDRAKRIAELRNIRLNIGDIKSSEDFLKQAYGKDKTFGQGVDENLATAKLVQSNVGDTVDTYYKGMVGQLGVSAQEAKRVVENQENLILQLSTQRDSVSGVSVDDEMIDMMQFQRAYQANAKMINVVDELLDLVVNRLVR